MQFRRPLPTDFAQMVNLQNQNLATQLSPEDRVNGFLSASLSVEQFQAIDQDLCVVVCSDSNHVCAYACASSIEYNKSIPLVEAMIQQLSMLSYQGKPLTDYHSFIYGPVCIDQAHRGQGILAPLLETLLNALPPQFDLLLTLISKDNLRSIHAHQKLGIEKVGEFEFRGQLFLILARSNLLNHISKNDPCHLFMESGAPDAQKVLGLLKFTKQELAVATNTPISSIHYDDKMSQELKDCLLEWAVALNLVAIFFNNDIHKTTLWFSTPNPLLGDISPREMIIVGRFKKLYAFIQTTLNENQV